MLLPSELPLYDLQHPCIHTTSRLSMLQSQLGSTWQSCSLYCAVSRFTHHTCCHWHFEPSLRCLDFDNHTSKLGYVANRPCKFEPPLWFRVSCSRKAPLFRPRGSDQPQLRRRDRPRQTKATPAPRRAHGPGYRGDGDPALGRGPDDAATRAASVTATSRLAGRDSARPGRTPRCTWFPQVSRQQLEVTVLMQI